MIHCLFGKSVIKYSSAVISRRSSVRLDKLINYLIHNLFNENYATHGRFLKDKIKKLFKSVIKKKNIKSKNLGEVSLIKYIEDKVQFKCK